MDTDTKERLPRGCSPQSWGLVKTVWERLLSGDAPHHEAIDYLMDETGRDRKTVIRYLRWAAAYKLETSQPNNYWDITAPLACNKLRRWVVGVVEKCVRSILHRSGILKGWVPWCKEARRSMEIIRALNRMK